MVNAQVVHTGIMLASQCRLRSSERSGSQCHHGRPEKWMRCLSSYTAISRSLLRLTKLTACAGFVTENTLEKLAQRLLPRDDPPALETFTGPKGAYQQLVMPFLDRTITHIYQCARLACTTLIRLCVVLGLL